MVLDGNFLFSGSDDATIGMWDAVPIPMMSNSIPGTGMVIRGPSPVSHAPSAGNVVRLQKCLQYASDTAGWTALRTTVGPAGRHSLPYV